MTDIPSPPVVSTTTTHILPSQKNWTTVVMKQKHVTFQSVTVWTFRRCLGLCVVPTHGGWPLGMEYDDSLTTTTSTTNNNNTSSSSSNSSSNTKDHTPSNWNDSIDMNGPHMCYSIDEYENERYERLYERYQKLQQATTLDATVVPNNNNNKSKDRSITKNRGGGDNTRKMNHQKGIVLDELLVVLETRQWDYKNRQKNPLFGILHESDRMNLLLNSCSPPDAVEVVTTTTAAATTTTTNPSTNSSSGRNSNQSKSTARTRSNGSLSGANASHHGTSGNGEQFNHIYTSTYVHSVRNALEQIRIDRTTGIGCSCRKLQVPIVSSSSTATATTASNNHSKKSHTGNSNNKRMKLQKLKDELTKRNLFVASNESDTTASTMTREEMEQLLHDTVEKEPCCLYTDTCFCARNGIGCQADVCTCWHSSHSNTGSNTKSDKKSSSSAITVQEIQQRCGNNVGGMYVVDDHKIDTFRNDYLNRLKVCPFITFE
jgi:hypothetical protein